MNYKQFMVVFITYRKHVSCGKPLHCHREANTEHSFLAQFRASSILVDNGRDPSSSRELHVPLGAKAKTTAVALILPYFDLYDSAFSILWFHSSPTALVSLSGLSTRFFLGLECSSLHRHLATFLTSFKTLLTCYLRENSIKHGILNSRSFPAFSTVFLFFHRAITF